MKNLDSFDRKGGIAQGYVRIHCWDVKTGETTYDSFLQKNTVVNDARRSAAAAFANTPGLVGLGFQVKQYRCGYSNVLANHWDNVNNKPLEAPFTESIPLIQYPGVPVSPNQDYFHTQADVSGLIGDGLEWTGVNTPLAPKAIPLSVVYPFSGDEYCVQLQVSLDALTSVGAAFDTVEIILTNGRKMAHRWTYPITKQPGWGLAIEHLVLF